MIQTQLVKELLKNAEAVKDEFNYEYLCASHIAVAVADFCKTEYTGFSFSDNLCPTAPFEEERVRFIFSKEIKLSSYFRTCLSMHSRHEIKEDEFDTTAFEHIAKLRGNEVLTADVVFLCALKGLQGAYTKTLCSEMTDENILALLEDTDNNIYDFVIDKIEIICSMLKDKSEKARAKRDWKPAIKFAEPDELARMFFDSIEKNVSENVVTLKLPKFFGTTDLKLSIHQFEEIYYVNDNGCAIKHLSKNIKDKEKLQRVIKKVCNPCWIDKGRIRGSFIHVHQFIYYLQKLVFIAHADLYYTKAEKQLYSKEKDYVYITPDKAETIEQKALVDELKKGINFDYDINAGLYYWLDTTYSLFSTRAAFLMETLENGIIRISDRRKGRYEGEILEAFYWDNEDISLYTKFISKISSRFGAEFDGKNIYLTDKKENAIISIFKFFNLAVLLSEFGHDIALPKIKVRSKNE